VFWQGSLFGTGAPDVDAQFTTWRRTDLDECSWVDVARGWLSGADDVFEALTATLPWRQRTVTMYDRRVPEPRLTAWWTELSSSGAPLPVLARARAVLSRRYDCHFDSIGYNWYRCGDDSVAWHGDRFAKEVVDPTVAIVSVGAARPLRLRPRIGGRSLSFDVGYGDLLVMGGACQHEWQHCIPKLSRPVGPRISVTFRSDAANYRPGARDTRQARNQRGASVSPRQ